MHLVVLVAVVSLSLQTAAPPLDRIADAYQQFILARHLEASDDMNGAIAAYKRAMTLDPSAADIPAELAALYMRQNRGQDALDTAQQALAISPTNREAHRVAGIIYAALAESRRSQTQPGAAAAPDDNIANAIVHLSAALDQSDVEPDPNVRMTLARLYLSGGAYAKAIPLLADLVKQEPGWPEGPTLLVEAYAGAGRNADAIQWLEEAAPDNPPLYSTLAEFYERERRWRDAAGAYAKAVEIAPRSIDLKTRYASALVNAGGREENEKAREVLNDVLSARPKDPRALYLLSQAALRIGDLNAAEATSRGLIAANAKSPWGYYALAETLEERRQYQAEIDALTPAVAAFRTGASGDGLELGLLLPHLGFAYQQLGQFDKSLPVFEEAHRLSPADSAVTSYLIEANMAAKKFPAAAEIARLALADHPDDVRLMQLEAQALHQEGKTDQGILLLENAVKSHGDDPSSYVALAQLYSNADRGTQAVKVLQDAQAKFPADQSIPFELGAVLDRQKRFAEAEATFKQVLAREPENAAALNYLGYMLAEHGERLDESVGYIKKALALEPENGSYLDSLGWAYFKADQLDLAEPPLKRAADQLTTNSVIQDHYGDLLFKRGRYDQAIAAWTRALSGDGDSIDRTAIDKKIRSAKHKLGKI
jgi:tetratricopeptide (TPR) repeat protein